MSKDIIESKETSKSPSPFPSPQRGEGWGEGLINYLKEELNCYEEILSLTKRQRDALSRGREDTIKGIIKEKDILIDRVKEIDKNINLGVGNQGPAHAAPDLIRGKQGSGVESQIEVLAKKIESILSEIIKIENECSGAIANSMSEVAEEIKGLNKGRQIARGYSKKGIYTPKFISTKK